MSGTTIPLMTKREFNFATAAGSVVIIRSLDVSQWTEGTLQVRIHENSNAGTAQIDVNAYAISNTPEEPSVDYLDGTAVATVSVGVSGTDTAPLLKTAALASGFGGALQIKVEATAGSTVQATLSAALVMKD